MGGMSPLLMTRSAFVHSSKFMRAEAMLLLMQLNGCTLVLSALQATTKEPSSVVPPASAAPTEEGPLLSVAAATSISLSSSGMSSEDAPMEESMELDANNSALTTPVQPAMTPQVISSLTEAVVATNIATPITPGTGSSGPSDTTNTVLECWADIVSSKEAEALKMDEQAG
ncbi:hypothetical protein C0989_006585 [Termitomyces sp. Mn162]|nr:hypothetical protein C0989_006585 [Termitomyces sp. Mn162]